MFLNNEKAVLKKLEENYADALAEINDKIAILLGRQDADMTHVIYQVQYQQSLKKQVEAILETLHSNEFETISEYLTKSYEDGFLTTMYNLQGQGIPLVFPLDQEQIVAAIQHETKLSETLYTTLGKDTKDLSKKIAGEITRGIAGGQMYAEVARNISNWARIPKNNAMRITRTEMHRIQTKASMDACEKAKSKGADVVKSWDSSLDKRTRDSHRKVDGEIRELDEKFSNGLEYPGDPSGGPGEVINCRCALLQRARWALGNDYTKWSPDAPVVIDDDGTTQFTIIEAKNYEDFQKKYKQASERVRENVQKINDVESDEKNGKIVIDESIIFRNADKDDYNRLYKQHSKNTAKEDVEQIKKHTKANGSSGGYVATANYTTINSNMRNDGFVSNKLDADDLSTIKSLQNAISHNTLDDDYYLTRYVNADYLTSVFGVKFNPFGKGEETIHNSIVEAANFKRFIPKVTEDMQPFVGKVITEKAFVSTSLLDEKNIMQNKPVMFLIEAPKGTNCYIPKNRKESECILGDNTQLFIRSIEFNPTENKWIVNARYLGAN